MRIYGKRTGRNNMVGLLARSYMYNSRGKKDIYEEIENRKWKDMGKGWKIAIGILWGLFALEALIILTYVARSRPLLKWGMNCVFHV